MLFEVFATILSGFVFPPNSPGTILQITQIKSISLESFPVSYNWEYDDVCYN